MKQSQFNYVSLVVILTSLTSFVMAESTTKGLQVGYGLLEAKQHSTAPAAAALGGFHSAEGTLVWATGAEAMAPIRRGQLLVDNHGNRTTLALVNPAAEEARVTLTLRNAEGTAYLSEELTLGGGQYLAHYVDDLFPNLTAGFLGTLVFDSQEPLGVFVLRQNVNTYGEPLFTSFPVVDLDADLSRMRILPWLLSGSQVDLELVAEVFMTNPSAEMTKGRIHFFGPTAIWHPTSWQSSRTGLASGKEGR
jgi:hypothetical protein